MSWLDAEIYDRHTPLQHVETKNSIHRAPAIGSKNIIECPNCMDTFDTDFIAKFHTFPAGTTRKVTDVFHKEVRANHLLPDSATADCEDGMMAVSRAASSSSGDAPLFCGGPD